MQNYFVRTFILNDTLKKIRMLIEQHQTDPENIKRIRLALSEAAGDIILLEETLSYLREVLCAMYVCVCVCVCVCVLGRPFLT